MKFGRYILSGILTIIPLWVTWFVFTFVLGWLSRTGAPLGNWVESRLKANYPSVAEWLLPSWLPDLLAVASTLIGLYLLGWFANRVVGLRLIGMLDSLINRVPLAKQIYGGVKQMIGAMQKKPDGAQRVVLIEFPSPEMKAVGFVTRVMTEPSTGRKLAVVYVPTTPNPTSGYMEIVPLERVVDTDWTLDEAMNFIISAGAVAPDNIYFTNKNDIALTDTNAPGKEAV